MEPLDLTTARPRKARAELAGIIFLPRSIDKFRAALPGGTLNGYTIEGFTETMLDDLGISIETMQKVVADAETDDDVVEYVTANAVAGGADKWNTFVQNREVYKGNRAEAIAENPWLADHPEIKYSIDFLQYREDNNIDDD